MAKKKTKAEKDAEAKERRLAREEKAKLRAKAEPILARFFLYLLGIANSKEALEAHQAAEADAIRHYLPIVAYQVAKKRYDKAEAEGNLDAMVAAARTNPDLLRDIFQKNVRGSGRPPTRTFEVPAAERAREYRTELIRVWVSVRNGEKYTAKLGKEVIELLFENHLGEPEIDPRTGQSKTITVGPHVDLLTGYKVEAPTQKIVRKPLPEGWVKVHRRRTPKTT